jgi:hypothetical protein
MDIKEFLEKTIEKKNYGFYSTQEIRPRIVCNDGESVSIQASEMHYCSPRKNCLKSYQNVEAGYPSVIPPKSWFKYAESRRYDELTATVYGYIPIEIAQEFIDIHGGIDKRKTFEKKEVDYVDENK